MEILLRALFPVVLWWAERHKSNFSLDEPNAIAHDALVVGVRDVDAVVNAKKPAVPLLGAARNTRQVIGHRPIFRTLLIVLRKISEVSDGTQEICSGVQA